MLIVVVVFLVVLYLSMDSFAAKNHLFEWMDDHIPCTMAPGSCQLASSHVPHKWLLDFVHSFM